MPGILIPRRDAVTRQPQGIMPPQGGGAFGGALNSLYNAANGRAMWVKGRHLQFPAAANSSRGTGFGGVGMRFNGSSQYEQLPASALSETVHTRIAVLKWDGTTRSTISSGITVNGALLWEIQTDGALVQVKTNTVETVHSASGVVVAGETCVLAMSWDGATSRLFKNGVQVTSASYTGGFNTGATPVFGKHYDNVFFFGGDIYLHADFGVALDPMLIARLTASLAAPWQLYAPSVRALWISAGGASQDLAAAAQAQAAGAADLAKGVSLAAASLGVSGASAGLSLAVPLAATATAVATAQGQVALTVNLSAAAIATATAAAGLSVGKPLAAAAAGQASATAGLNVVNSGLAAAAVGQSAATATISLAINLSAAAVAQASASAGLGGSTGLAAAAIANAQASAALAVGKPLAAAGTAQASAGATLWLQVPVAAAALAQASAQGGLSLTVNLTAGAIASAQASAGLAKGARLAAAAIANAQASAALQQTVAVTLQAGAVAQSSASASLSFVLRSLSPTPGFGAQAKARAFQAAARPRRFEAAMKGVR